MIRWVYEEKGSVLSLAVTGHAGFAPGGQDLVCAGVSTLVYALAQSVRDWEDRLDRPVYIRLEPGNARIRVHAGKKQMKQLKVAFRMAENGMKLLTEAFPENVAVGEKM
jgi:uncharacterized protein YsxB (DUF464 family)